MTTRITAAVMLSLTLAGCINAEKVYQPHLVDDRECRGLGLKPIEPAYVTCLAELDSARNGRSCFGSCH